MKHFCLQSRARTCFTSSYLVKINKATKNPSECVHDVSLLHRGLTIIQAGSYSVRIFVRPDREFHCCLKQGSVYTLRTCWGREHQWASSIWSYSVSLEIQTGKVTLERTSKFFCKCSLISCMTMRLYKLQAGLKEHNVKQHLEVSGSWPFISAATHRRGDSLEFDLEKLN